MASFLLLAYYQSCHTQGGGVVMKRVSRDGQRLKIVNPQNFAAMKITFERVRDGVFDEYDIRFLLSGIRPVVREMFYNIRNEQEVPKDMLDRWDMLMDLCDVVAHPEYKDQGALQRLIIATEEWLRNHFTHLSSAQQFAAEAQKILDFKFPEGIPIEKSYKLVSVFFIALEQYLGFDIGLEWFATERSNEVLLCFFTILHYTQVLVEPRKNEEHKGGSILMCGRQGMFALYASVEETRILDRVAGSLSSDHSRTFPIPLFIGVVTTIDASKTMDFYNPGIGLALRHENNTLGLFTLPLATLGFQK